jgi:phage tail-like protein
MMDARSILQLLPLAFREAERRASAGTPLMALLSVVEELLQPIDDVVAQLPRYIDPRTCPEPLLSQLSTWLCDGWVESVDSSCERELLAGFARYSAHRGTRRALNNVLRLVAGSRDISVEESATVPFHLTVSVPEALAPELARLERTLERHKPAHTTAEIRFVPPRPVLPAAGKV